MPTQKVEPKPQELSMYDVWACVTGFRTSYRATLVGTEKPANAVLHVGQFTDYCRKWALWQAFDHMRRCR